MSEDPTRTPPNADRPAIALSAAVIVLAIAAVYLRGLGGAFLYDDLDSIPGNPSIRHLSTALRPPAGTTVAGRPILNLSLAVNFLVSGTAPWSYHLLNIAIHALAALCLFGIARRSLVLVSKGRWEGRTTKCLATTAALFWALHPLQTESVAYVIQRGESLMGLFYLATLYAAIRYLTEGGRRWAVASLGACVLGMGTKETMVTAPLIVLLYDRTFVSGAFGTAWLRRRPFYCGLAACWIPLAALVSTTAGRGGTAGFHSGVTVGDYALVQARAIARYLRLSFDPQGLVGDYGRRIATDPAGAALGIALVAALAAASVALLWRRNPLGFLGAWFLVVLAPSSSVVPVATELIAEHRMYLPLAGVVLAAVILLSVAPRPIFVGAAIALAGLLGLLSARRVDVYRSGFAFWSDVVSKRPENAGAWNNLALLEAGQGNASAAELDFRKALALVPDYADAHANLGRLLAAWGKAGEAAGHLRSALRFRPDDAGLHADLARSLGAQGESRAAEAEYREALRLDPTRAQAWFGLGELEVDAGRLDLASEAYAQAVRLRPDSAEAKIDYGNVLAESGHPMEAERQLDDALRLQPGAADVHNNLGSLLAGTGRLDEAKSQFEEALRLKPDYAEARQNLERVRALLAQRAP
ncbi:MAG TPA: tetratricopeptide repeat protein [Opitutaceae bacterium]